MDLLPWTWKKGRNFPVFVIIYLVSYLTLIMHSRCLFTTGGTEIYRRLLNEISFSIFFGLRRKLLSENTFHN